jgi:hypothetical protein
MDDAHHWSEPFDPQAPGLNYTEGNAYQYSLFVPHDVPGLTALLGGKAALANYLDTLFTTPMTLDLGAENDISGLIGQYAHGNEPSHHLAYFYCFAGQPWKTQAMVRRILREQYDASPAGLNGNEDCGQMSAWYVMSALGFYPVCPGQTTYVIGSPLFDRVSLHLEKGRTFTVTAQANSRTTPYIQSAQLNGHPLTSCFLEHATVVAGGELRFQMGHRPNAAWGTSEPEAFWRETRVSAVPYLTETSDKFLTRFPVEMRCSDPKAEIRYTLDGSIPGRESKKFEHPFEVTVDTTIKMRTFADGAEPGIVVARAVSRSAPCPIKATPVPGLRYAYYEGIYRSVYDFANDSPANQGVVECPTLDVPHRKDWFALAFDGLLQIPRDGEYTFYVAAKDGGQLRVDGDEQFESDGRKDTALPQQSTLALCKGWHRFQLKFYKCTDNITLTVEWSGPGTVRSAIPREAFFHEPE